MKVICLFHFQINWSIKLLSCTDSSPHGICLVKNNYVIPTTPAASPRSLFQHLEFYVHVKQDLNVDDISSTAQEFAAKDHSQFDAFVFFILLNGGYSYDVI